MIEKGYYIKARKIQDSKIATQPPYVREIWDWLMKEANHSDKKYGGKLIKRGQLFRSYSDIRDGLHWFIGWRKMTYNENQTKKAMKFLREARMVTTMKEPGGMLITICNYDYYQDPTNYERTNERTNERTIEEPLKNQTLPDNNKNVKNKKNINTVGIPDRENFENETFEEEPLFSKKEKKPTPPGSGTPPSSVGSDSELRSIFEKFRLKYPGVKRGTDTEFEYLKKHKDWKDVVVLLSDAVNEQIIYRDKLRESGEFVPPWKNLKTWIYNRCWEDEVGQEKTLSTKLNLIP